MNRGHIFLAGILVTICFLAACTPKRPVIFEDPDFSRDEVSDEKTAFLLPAHVDIKPMRQDFVRAFEGRPGRGERLLLEKLRGYLSGEETINHPGDTRFVGGLRCEFRDFSSLVDTTGLGELLVYEVDAYDLLQLQVVDPAKLAGWLQEAGLDHLIVLGGLQAGREAKITKDVLLGTFAEDDPTLTAMMFIWGRQNQAVLWQGYVIGAAGVYINFTANTAQEMVRDLVSDIYKVIN